MKSIFAILSFLFLSVFSYGQWFPGGIQLSSTPDNNYNQQIAMNSNNSAWEVWRAEDTISPNKGKIYLIAYDKFGVALSGFAAGAKAIASNGNYYMPQIIMNGDTEVIVTWYGYPDTLSNLAQVYIQKYNKSGLPLWNGGNAIRVSQDDSTHNKFPQVASDKNGGIYICWTRFDNNLDPSSSKVLLQRLDNNGNIASGWAITPKAIGDVVNQNEWYAKMAVTPTGDAVYIQYIRGLITALSEWMVRINAADGSAATGFSAGSGVQISAGPNLNPIFVVENFVFCDSLGNALSIWTENRISANGEIYYQKTSATGTQTFPSTAKRIAANNSNGYGYLYASLDDDGSILAAWNDYAVNYDVGCIKFKTSGTTVWQHSNTPVTSNNNSAYPKIIPDHQGGSYIFYDNVTGYPYHLYCLRLDSAGNLPWSLPGLFVGTNYDQSGFDPQFGFTVANVNSGQANVTWEGNANTLFGVFACDVLPSEQSCFDAPNSLSPIKASSSKVIIYPNPSHDHFTVSFTENWGAVQWQFELFDELGSLIMKRSIKDKAVINTFKMAPGLYFGKFFDEKGNYVQSQKIIIEH